MHQLRETKRLYPQWLDRHKDRKRLIVKGDGGWIRVALRGGDGDKSGEKER